MKWFCHCGAPLDVPTATKILTIHCPVCGRTYEFSPASMTRTDDPATT